MGDQQLSAFNPTTVDEGGWFHARKLVENHDRSIVDGIVWFLSSLSADELDHAQNLFDNYDLKTVRGIFEFLSPPKRDSTTTLRTIASGSSNAWTISSSASSIYSESRTSLDSGLSSKVTSASNASARAKCYRGSSKSDYPCFCTFHQESGDPKPPLNRKSDWKRHEDDFHNGNESWHCRWCSDRFLSFRALEAHCKKLKDHPKVPSKNEVLCQRFLSRVRFACGFPACKYNGLFHTWDKRCDHLAEHMKEYAELNGTGHGGDQWAASRWEFSTRLRRLLNQPETEQHWTNLMIATHGPNEASWPVYWAFNDRSQILAHKLECRDFRPSPKEVAECAVYLAWMSAGTNAPDASRFDNFIRKVLRLPSVDNLPSRRSSRDLEVALKRFSEAQLRSQPVNHQPHQPSPLASPANFDATLFENTFSQGALLQPSLGLDMHAAQFNTPLSDQNLLNNLYLTSEDDPEEEGPHPGNLWVPRADLPSWLHEEPAPDSAQLESMDIDFFSPPVSQPPPPVSQPPPPQHAMSRVDHDGNHRPVIQHRRPSQIFRHLPVSFPLSHKRVLPG